MHLNTLTATITGEEPVTWATREYAEPMGFSDMFLFDGLENGGISASGTVDVASGTNSE